MTKENESLPQPWNEESEAGIRRLIEERDRFRELAAKKTAEAEDNLVRAVLAERENAKLRAEVERLKAESTVAAVSVLVDHARGVLMHRYEGACPDSVEGPDVRDPECPVCRAIDSVSRLRPIGPGGVVS